MLSPDRRVFAPVECESDTRQIDSAGMFFGSDLS